MQGRAYVATALAMLAILMAAAGPTAAQQKSKSGQIVLIARMPETLTLALNRNVKSGIGASSQGFDYAGLLATATSVTASWVLARGRSHIATWSHIKHPAAPVTLALAVPGGIEPYGETFTDSPFRYSFSARPSVSSRKLDILNIADSNRAAASTVSLSDSIETAASAPVPEDAYLGTMKIQVQVVP